MLSTLVLSCWSEVPSHVFPVSPKHRVCFPLLLFYVIILCCFSLFKRVMCHTWSCLAECENSEIISFKNVMQIRLELFKNLALGLELIKSVIKLRFNHLLTPLYWYLVLLCSYKMLLSIATCVKCNNTGVFTSTISSFSSNTIKGLNRTNTCIFCFFSFSCTYLISLGESYCNALILLVLISLDWIIASSFLIIISVIHYCSL